MTKERYLLMCEQLGNEPIQEEIPADYEDFPYEVQTAINIYSILPDRWEGMSGTYMGKDLGILPYISGIYEIDNDAQLLQFIRIIDSIVMEQRSKEQKQRETKQKRKLK